jgi:hypothetical protein
MTSEQRSGIQVDNSYSGDTLGYRLKRELVRYPPKVGSRYIIYNIQAVSALNDTVKLNPMVFMIK